MALSALASLVTLPYLADLCGFGLAPAASVVGSGLVTTAVAIAFGRDARWTRLDLGLWTLIVTAIFVALLSLSWPSLLPLGGGPDLTHHLALVDYLEREGHLVEGPEAGGQLGEMADYTPGLHVMAVVVGRVIGRDGFHALYPVVALSVALKVGFVFLILMRLLRGVPQQAPLAVGGVLMIVATSAYSLTSFTHDSFLAQVVAEFFAVAAWWAIVWWDRQPTRGAMALFASATIGVFLTWPVWLGPLVLTLCALALIRRDISQRRQIEHLSIALAPVFMIALIHMAGRIGAMGIVGTSGAVLQPTPEVLGLAVPVLAVLGVLFAVSDWRYRSLAIFAAALALQAIALWVVATLRGAATPYMAIKMTYLAIYPGAVAAIVAIATAWEGIARVILRRDGDDVRRMQRLAWVATAVLTVVVVRDVIRTPQPPPIVSEDLWAAGRWLRATTAPECVDYLVDNGYTAYWLHIAVMGNARAAARSIDEETYRSQAAFGRWLVREGPPYAITNLDVLPAEILREVDIVRQFGRVAVIKRRSHQAGCG
ncbi:MAG TPA: hypothetical protein VNJ02_06695 [Vicinamibacterales bacterium]|nr:hypothetical protein [Vicinamibacterales bacterium]